MQETQHSKYNIWKLNNIFKIKYQTSIELKIKTVIPVPLRPPPTLCIYHFPTPYVYCPLFLHCLVSVVPMPPIIQSLLTGLPPITLIPLPLMPLNTLSPIPIIFLPPISTSSYWFDTSDVSVPSCRPQCS